MQRLKQRMSWRRRRALRSARMLDDMVDAQVVALPLLPEDVRSRSADQLAELVMLAQTYRHFSAGWITRSTLDRRCKEIVARLEGSGSGAWQATHRA